MIYLVGISAYSLGIVCGLLMGAYIVRILKKEQR
jgi:hypothetical protein